MDQPSLSASRRIALHLCLPMVLLAAAVWFAFLPVFSAPLAFDDDLTIKHVKQFTEWHQVLGIDSFRYFRPVKNLFFYWGVSVEAGAKAYHMATLLAYFAATCSVFLLARQLAGGVVFSTAGALFWALSPSGGTVAVWASCFNISIAAACICICLIAYDRARSDCRRRGLAYGTATLFLILGLLSYETAVATAPLLVLTDIYRRRSLFDKRALAGYAAIAAIVIAWLVLRHFAGATSMNRNHNPGILPDMPAWQLCASAPYFLWVHLTMWAAPEGRLELLGSYIWDKSIPAVILPFCWLLLLGTIFLTASCWRRAPLFFFGIAWFLIMSFPSGNFLPLWSTPYADYYVTIPSIGLCLSLTAVARGAMAQLRKPGANRLHVGGAIATLVVIAGWRTAQLPVLREWLLAWRMPIEITARTAAARPHQFYAHAVTAHGLATLDEEKTDAVLDTIEWNANQAMIDAPNLDIVYSSLAVVARERGDKKKAIELFETSLLKNRGDVDGRLWCHEQAAELLGEDPERYDRAFAHVLVLLKQRHHPRHPEFVLLAAKLMREAGKTDEELEALEKGHRYHPENKDILAKLEDARKRAGKPS